MARTIADQLDFLAQLARDHRDDLDRERRREAWNALDDAVEKIELAAQSLRAAAQ